MSFYSQSNFRKQYNQKELGDPGPLFDSWPLTYALFITGIVLAWVVIGWLAFS
jgi:hypothetical protein